MESPNDINSRLNELERLSDLAKDTFIRIVRKKDAKNIQHQVLFILLARVIKYFDAYLLLVRNGYGEPAVSVLRSIYESCLWIRWSLCSQKNAQIYFDASKGESARMFQIFLDRKLITLTNVPDPELLKSILRNKLKDLRLPHWSDIADDTGYDDWHALVYPMLSAMTHGNLASLGNRVETMEVSPFPDQVNIMEFIGIAHNIFRDCFLVCDSWIIEGLLHPVPNARKLMVKD